MHRETIDRIEAQVQRVTGTAPKFVSQTQVSLTFDVRVQLDDDQLEAIDELARGHGIVIHTHY